MGWIRDLFTAVLNMSVTGGINDPGNSGSAYSAEESTPEISVCPVAGRSFPAALSLGALQRDQSV